MDDSLDFSQMSKIEGRVGEEEEGKWESSRDMRKD